MKVPSPGFIIHCPQKYFKLRSKSVFCCIPEIPQTINRNRLKASIPMTMLTQNIAECNAWSPKVSRSWKISALCWKSTETELNVANFWNIKVVNEQITTKCDINSQLKFQSARQSVVNFITLCCVLRFRQAFWNMALDCFRIGFRRDVASMRHRPKGFNST